MTENDDLLATLRRLDAEASLGPWWVHSMPARTARLYGEEDQYIANFAPTGSWKRRQFNARLATLAHEVLLLVEALMAARYTDWPDAKPLVDAALARVRERVAALEAAP